MINDNNVKVRINALIKDFKVSFTEKNKDYVTGIIYGLTIAKAAIDAEVKANVQAKNSKEARTNE